MRQHLTQNLVAQHVVTDTSTPMGKVMHLQNAFKAHINSLKILLSLTPEVGNFSNGTINEIVNGSWIWLKFLRGVPMFTREQKDKATNEWAKSLTVKGLSGNKYKLKFFLDAGMKQATLDKVLLL